jgi:hypothetical protein
MWRITFASLVGVGDMCSMVGSDEYYGTSRRFGTEDWGWSSTGQLLGHQAVDRSGDIVCGQYRAQGDDEREFLG